MNAALAADRIAATGKPSRHVSFTRATMAALSAMALSASAFLFQPAVSQADTNASLQTLQAPAPLAESSFEQQILDLVNQDRAVNGLGPVSFDPSLLATARQRAADQLTQSTLNHYDAIGQLAFVKLLSRDGISYQLAGENLARLPGIDDSTAPRAEDALMHSPTHRANILEPTFNHIAVGATLDDQGRVVFAQIFSAN